MAIHSGRHEEIFHEETFAVATHANETAPPVFSTNLYVGVSDGRGRA